MSGHRQGCRGCRGLEEGFHSFIGLLLRPSFSCSCVVHTHSVPECAVWRVSGRQSGDRGHHAEEELKEPVHCQGTEHRQAAPVHAQAAGSVKMDVLVTRRTEELAREAGISQFITQSVGRHCPHSWTRSSDVAAERLSHQGLDLGLQICRMAQVGVTGC